MDDGLLTDTGDLIEDAIDYSLSISSVLAFS